MSMPSLPLASLALAALIAGTSGGRRRTAAKAEREAAAFELGVEAGRLGYVPVR